MNPTLEEVGQTGQTVVPGFERESIVNDEPHLHAVFEVGDASRQGDLYFVRIATMPSGARPATSRQLANGSTQGARHIAERGDVYDAPAEDISAAIKVANGCGVPARYVGKIYVSPQSPTADDVSHPEHGNQGFPAGTICAVVHQRNQDKLEGERRAAD